MRHLGSAISLLVWLPLVLSVPLALGFLSHLHPFFDSFAHLRIHLAALLILLSLPLLASRHWKPGTTALVVATAALATVLPASAFFGPNPVNAAGGPDAPRAVYRLLHLNLRYDSPEHARMLSVVGRANPDAILLNEVSEQWLPALDRLTAAYPFRLVCGSESPYGGVAVLSRRPFDSSRSPSCFGGSLAIASVNFGGQPVDLASLHLTWPWPFRQAEEIDDLAPGLAGLAPSAILLGDLNATSWSAAVERVATTGGLTQIRSIRPTWFAIGLPKAMRPWLGLGIDHAFAKGDVVVDQLAIGPDAGSDHLPLLVEFSLLNGAPDGERDRQTASSLPALPGLRRQDRRPQSPLSPMMSFSTAPPSPCSLVSKSICRRSNWA